MPTTGARREGSSSVPNTRVVRTGVPRAQGGRGNAALIRAPFLFIILGTVALGGLNATRAYKKEKEAYPSHHPFLP
ncbi:protein caj1 [Fagus crenata]